MGFTKLEFPFRTQYGELGPLVPKFLGMGNMGFFPKVDERYGDGDREYNALRSGLRCRAASDRTSTGRPHWRATAAAPWRADASPACSPLPVPPPVSVHCLPPPLLLLTAPSLLLPMRFSASGEAPRGHARLWNPVCFHSTDHLFVCFRVFLGEG